MKWIEGCPDPELVRAHCENWPDWNPLHREDSATGEIEINWSENRGVPEERFHMDKVLVSWPARSGLWICFVPRSLGRWATGARMQHLRTHPENKRVLYSIDCRTWGYLDLTVWGSVSKFIPATPEGVPVDYQGT